MDIRPIRTEDHHNWALAEITRYFENEPEPDSTDGDRFDVLATLIEAYEDEHYPATVPDPVESIRLIWRWPASSKPSLPTRLAHARVHPKF